MRMHPKIRVHNANREHPKLWIKKKIIKGQIYYAIYDGKHFVKHIGNAEAYTKYLNDLEKLESKKKALTQRTYIPDMPSGKYNVIYADPPWDIESMVLEKWESPLEDKYPTMKLKLLKNLKIEELCADDCVCFLWATHTTLPKAFELLRDWRFKYHCLLTWDKGGGWCVGGFHRKTELVLVGYRGILSNVVKEKGEYIPTLFYEKKTTHSTKPQIMYELIESRTIGKRIELFARNKREGWDVWGLDVNDK